MGLWALASGRERLGSESTGTAERGRLKGGWYEISTDWVRVRERYVSKFD